MADLDAASGAEHVEPLSVRSDGLLGRNQQLEQLVGRLRDVARHGATAAEPYREIVRRRG